MGFVQTELVAKRWQPAKVSNISSCDLKKIFYFIWICNLLVSYISSWTKFIYFFFGGGGEFFIQVNNISSWKFMFKQKLFKFVDFKVSNILSWPKSKFIPLSVEEFYSGPKKQTFLISFSKYYLTLGSQKVT